MAGPHPDRLVGPAISEEVTDLGMQFSVREKEIGGSSSCSYYTCPQQIHEKSRRSHNNQNAESDEDSAN